jgi:hypothetical protein
MRYDLEALEKCGRLLATKSLDEVIDIAIHSDLAASAIILTAWGAEVSKSVGKSPTKRIFDRIFERRKEPGVSAYLHSLTSILIPTAHFAQDWFTCMCGAPLWLSYDCRAKGRGLVVRLTPGHLDGHHSPAFCQACGALVTVTFEEK